VEGHANDPFVLLGMNTDSDKATFLKRSRDGGVTWRNSLQGDSKSSAAAKAWGVEGYPMNYVIDAKGTIRAVGLRGAALDREVDALVAEAQAGSGH
jgi:hypothetical protein